MEKTTYTVADLRMVFVLPDRTQHEVMATKVDHPKTMCEVLDLLAGLAPYERRAIIVMATEYEMRNMYPRLDQDVRRPDSAPQLSQEDEG